MRRISGELSRTGESVEGKEVRRQRLNDLAGAGRYWNLFPV